MEDSDVHQDRKRPRLEGGDSLAADEALTDGGGCPQQQVNVPSTSTSTPEPPSNTTVPPPSSSTNESPPRPASMVTINTRPSSSTAHASPPPLEHAEGGNATSASDLPIDSHQQQQDTGRLPHSSSHSPTRSPEIQVAEPEDIDQDPSLTKWRSNRKSHKRDINVDLDFNYVYKTFPLARYCQPHKVEGILEEFAKEFRYGKVHHDPNMFEI